jgi:uncharacterized membrane protein (DUF485 family)
MFMGANEKVYKREIVGSQLDYTQIAQSSSFKKLLSKKRSFILPMSLFFLIFYFALPIMTAYSDVLNGKAFGDISWAWVFAFSQFVMTWALCSVYSRKAGQFDEMVEEIIEESMN